MSISSSHPSSGDACGLAVGPEVSSSGSGDSFCLLVGLVVVGGEEAKGQPDCIDCQGHPGGVGGVEAIGQPGGKVGVEANLAA